MIRVIPTSHESNDVRCARRFFSRVTVRNTWLFIFAFSLLALTQVSLLPAQQPDSSECHHVTLFTPLGWAISGAWSQEGNLLVPDVLGYGVAAVSSSGDVSPRFQEKLGSVGGLLLKSPSTIRPAYGGYLVEDDQSDKILYVNDHLELLDDPILIGNRKMADNLRLLEVYDWSPMSEGILAFGDLESPEEYQESAFLYFDFDDAGQNQIFYRIAITDNVRNHYTRNMPYIATLGNVGYILFMDERPAIGEVTFGEGIRRLQFFPEDFRSRPQLVRREAWTNAGMGARQATHFYKSLEMSTMAAGLYAWDGYLYLLAKEAIAQNGETAWWLIKLDPRDGMELSRVRLPTGAAHLTVVTGEVWGFIEKGPVQGIGAMHGPYMKTDSMVLIPAGWLEDPYGGRLDARSRTHCVKSRQFTTKD